MNILRRFFASILLASCSLLGFAQISTVSIDRDIRMLESLGASSGLDSREYNDRLLDLSSSYEDTCYHDYYAYFANAIIDNNDNLRKVYGIDSMEYREAMINLTNYFLFGRYVDDLYDNYEERAVAVLLGLEKWLKRVSSNKEQFLAILSVVYKHHFNDAKKALAYSKKGLEIAEKNKAHDPTNYAYALGSYIQDLSGQEANQEIANLVEELGIHLNNLMANTISPEEIGILISVVINNLPSGIPSSAYRMLAERYRQVGGSLRNINLTYMNAADENRADVLKVLEEVCVPAERDKANVVAFYLDAGIHIGHFGGNIELAVDYLTKAITLAESIGRNDLCYNTVDRAYHYWQSISRWDTQLGQHEKAIEAQKKAVDATFRDYGLESQEWIDAATYLSSLYSNMGDYEKEIQTSLVLLSVIDEMYGRMSADYMEQLLLTAGASRMYGFAEGGLLLLGNIDPEKIPDMAILFKYYNECGLCYINTKEYDKARECFDKAVAHSTTDGDRLAAMLNRTSISGEMGLYQQRVEELEELLRFAKHSHTLEPFDLFTI